MAENGKNKRRQLETFDNTHNVTLSVDSQEEIDFVQWLSEAKSLSVINDFQYQPPSWQLSEPVKYVDITRKERTLYREHQYSTDFLVTFDANQQQELAKELKVPYSALSSNECSVYIDVKGTFNRNARSFSTDRKWLWQKFKVYIYELIPKKFFEKFGCPEACKLTAKTKKPRKMFQGFRSLVEVFKPAHSAKS